MKTLQLSPDLKLPLDAITQTFAFLARRGAGKTYAAGKLAEEMFDAGGQVVILDPVGSFWGLRLLADGKGKGLSIPVLGGLHGDLPLEPTAGALIADLVVDRATSAVIDVSMFRKAERKRFAADFAEQLFERKKSKRTPIHLFIEEAQVFVPQRVAPDEARMLGAFEDLVKLGRNFGIGVTLISQRPQSVNKDALNQTECLVVLQTNGAQERKALRDWIVDQGLDVAGLIDTLPGLKRGEAWVWSPSWLGITKRVHIGKKRTLNASATPEQGDVGESVPLAPIDLEQLRQAMVTVVAEAEKHDPKALRARIAGLERQLAAKPAAATAKVEVAVLKGADLTRVEKLLERCEKLIGAGWEPMKALANGLTELHTAVRLTTRPAPVVRAVPLTIDRAAFMEASRMSPAPRVAAAPSSRNQREPVEPGGIGAGERRMLEALALRHPTRLSRAQLGTLSGYSASGGTFRTYLPKLSARGLVQYFGEEVGLTAAGLEEVGEAITRAPQTTDQLLDLWRGALEQGPRKMFDELVGVFPDTMTRAALGASTGYASTGGTFRTYLPKLHRLGLVEYRGEEVKASDALFMGAA